MAASPAAVTVESLLAVLTMESSCFEDVFTLVLKDLSTLPAILMASSIILLFAKFHHHLCQIVQLIQRHPHKIVDAAVEPEGEGDAALLDFRRGYSSETPP